MTGMEFFCTGVGLAEEEEEEEEEKKKGEEEETNNQRGGETRERERDADETKHYHA